MKRIFTLLAFLGTCATGFSQADTTGKSKNQPVGDTIRIGGMVIIRKAGNSHFEGEKEYKMHDRKGDKPSNLTTNYWVFDVGFSNFQDNTNYSGAAAQAYAPGSNSSWFTLKDGKSRNINIWFFMQKLNVVKHVMNLKYGVGVELNNYRFKYPLRFQKTTAPVANPPRVIYDTTHGRNYDKDKLAADYLTVPLLLNFNLTPNKHKGFGFSGGVSFGYLYSARNKTITSDEKKQKAKDDFELEKWKFSYIGELSLGSLKFYGSYTPNSIFKRGLDFKAYNVGFRFSNF